MQSYQIKLIRRIIISVLVLLLIAGLVVISIFLGIKAHNCQVLEMQTQIDTYGFYKKDIVMLIGNNYTYVWSLVGCVILTVLASFSLVGDICFLVNSIKEYKWWY